jgi:hypothetical protein
MNNLNEHKESAPGQNKEFQIIVNGREKTLHDKKVSFAQIVELAFGATNNNTVYTVTYKRGEDKKPEGSLVEGDTITVKSGMIFNVTATDKS